MPNRLFWKGLKVLITAGPTREYLDPIRYLTNASSGKMGLALAQEARRQGAHVTVVLGPTREAAPSGVAVARVVSARDMHREVMKLLHGLDLFIAAAAVGDWSFAKPRRSKIKKTGRAIALTFYPNPDILAEVGRRRGRNPRPIVAGFALETDKLQANAEKKLRRKNLDMIVANGPENLGGARARFLILDRSGKLKKFPPMNKAEAARVILANIEAYACRW